MSALIKITYPAENQILHPGGLSIRGIGPAGQKIRVALKEFEWPTGYWDLIVGNDGYWDASGAIVENGTWNVDAILISELALQSEKDHIIFHVRP
ncbi:hypothetical protein [Phyllobacterium leguminum]|uniref:Uncharacterized protein n=1 Tax=Phyllobacterium leguminum TaxID=314237 RepID=A0A318T196_9HYPH|nr:hypothetical protein [Phyllobacterium leguminum]PYE86349.1 hypothetical protein C7477_12713 [Phyllobacterium leguminum]